MALLVIGLSSRSSVPNVAISALRQDRCARRAASQPVPTRARATMRHREMLSEFRDFGVTGKLAMVGSRRLRLRAPRGRRDCGRTEGTARSLKAFCTASPTASDAPGFGMRRGRPSVVWARKRSLNASSSSNEMVSGIRDGDPACALRASSGFDDGVASGARRAKMIDQAVELSDVGFDDVCSFSRRRCLTNWPVALTSGASNSI